MPIRVILILILIFSLNVTGCWFGMPGYGPIPRDQAAETVESSIETELDHRAIDELWNWIEVQDDNGWEITGYPGTSYVGIILDHEFNPDHLKIAIDADVVNPFHQRNWMEDIVRKWILSYPSGSRPDFVLRVTIFDREIDPDREIGWSEIDKDGNIDTHHYMTQDII